MTARRCEVHPAGPFALDGGCIACDRRATLVAMADRYAARVAAGRRAVLAEVEVDDVAAVVPLRLVDGDEGGCSS